MTTTAAKARVDPLALPLALWVGLGTIGALGIALTSSKIGSVPRPPGYRWWLDVPTGSYDVAHLFFYSSVAILLLGWIGVGFQARHGRLSVAGAWRTLALWGGPLFAAAPVFSRDVYSYIAQGELVRHGFNPYLVAPRALGPGPVLSSIAVVWRDSTSPYGPLFVALTHVTNLLTPSSLIVQVLAYRTLGLMGVVLLMCTLPALARHFGVDGGVALWFGVLSPLALFSAISSAHNDTLMIGLSSLALLVGIRGSRRWAIVLLSVAATIKLPALAGVVFVSAGALRDVPPSRRWRIIGEAIALPPLVIAAVTELVGYGWGWLSPSALRIPTELRVLTTPVVSVGKLGATTLHAIGLHVSTSAIVTATQYVSELAAVALALVLVARTRKTNTVRMTGLALLIVVVASPTVWPWYYLWGLSLLAATSAQRSLFMAWVAGLAMLLVGPGGTPMIGGNGFYASGPLVLAGLFWFWSRDHWRTIFDGVDRVE